jgi:hypothetical protein
MNLRPPKFLYKIYRLPIIGDLIAYAGYAFLRSFGYLAPLLLRYKRIRLGTSIILTPNDKKQTILSGVECLRSHDSEMYSRLTKNQKLIFYYSGNKNITNLFGYFFGLQETYIKLGAEGIAYFIVQSLLVSDACPSVNQHRRNDREWGALKSTARKTMEWMQQHSFDQRLIDSYSKVVEKWEQSERFQR